MWFDIAIIGAGIAGVSAAAELAPYGRVLLIERESHPGFHATGRSAAILAQTYGNEAVRALTRASDTFLKDPPEGFAELPLLAPRGLVQIAREDQIDGLYALFDGLKGSGMLEWLNPDEIAQRVPILRPGYAAGGYENKNAQDLDVHAMVQGYLRALRRKGGTILTGTEVTKLTRNGVIWNIEAGGQTFAAETVINAAGAWADHFARMAGADPIGLMPLRRSAITIRPPKGLNPAGLPMIVDADEEFYLKPEAGMLLASPANETPSEPTDAQPDEMEVAVAVDRIMKAFDLDVRRIESKWAGLRTFAPDRVPVCGYDWQAEGFFWLAGQGGYGIQTAPALSRLTAHLVAGAPLDPDFVAVGLDPAKLSPTRNMQSIIKTP